MARNQSALARDGSENSSSITAATGWMEPSRADAWPCRPYRSGFPHEWAFL